MRTVHPNYYLDSVFFFLLTNTNFNPTPLTSLTADLPSSETVVAVDEGWKEIF